METGTEHDFVDGNEYVKCETSVHFGCHGGPPLPGWCSVVHNECEPDLALLEAMTEAWSKGRIDKLALLASSNPKAARLNEDRLSLQFMDCEGDHVIKNMSLSKSEYAVIAASVPTASAE